MMEGVPDPDAFRASDADREAVIRRLQRAFAEGRLDLSELEERTAGVYAARTFGELRAFTRDLPPPAAVRRPARPRVIRLPHALLPVVAINVVAWVLASLARGATLDGHGDWIYPWWVSIAAVWVVFEVGAVVRRRGHGDGAGTAA